MDYFLKPSTMPYAIGILHLFVMSIININTFPLSLGGPKFLFLFCKLLLCNELMNLKFLQILSYWGFLRFQTCFLY